MIASPVIAKNKKSAFDYQAFLDEAYSRLTVEQIYTDPSHQFKRSGEKYRGGCPLHDSKSGTSFNVTARNLLFNCPACQFGGDPIIYLHSLKVGRWEKPRGKDFIEAAKQLTEIAGMTFPDLERSPEEIEKVRQWESRREILQSLTEYGEEVLWSSRGIDARNYLVKDRGFTEEQIKSLNLGLYLSHKEVTKVLLAKGHNLDDLKNAGVLWSKLEGYILFPWNDSQGRPLTIYGRYQDKVPPEGKPKTIALKGEGTKQSPLHLDRALKAGHENAVLVEGVMDAALLQVKGDTRVIAYVGASCSELQIKTLVKRRIKSVTLCGDPDTGGDNGTMSNIRRIMSADIDVYVAPRLPDGLDPDEFVNKVGIEGWKNHIDNAVHAFTYMARFILHKHDITNDRGKISAISEAFDYAKQFTQPKSKLSIEALFWTEICDRLGIDKQELVGRFQTGTGNEDNSDTDNEDEANIRNNQPSSKDSEWRRQRQNWNSPVSHQGEIGFWQKDKNGKSFFVPACNFDFQVEREIEDADGGGLVLQVKRVFDDNQVRVILNSTDYTKPDTFTDALKREIKAGIVCNLTKPELNALVHTRLHEYRSTRQGRLYKRIDRYGQQTDGIWVFGNRQYTKDGTPTNENESGWVFNSSLGKEDFIPCPELAEENPQALKILVDASREFFGQQNIYQVLLKMGWVAAGLNFQEIYRQTNCFPLENSYGPPGSCKTLASETALSLVGKNWAEHGMLARVSTSALYEHGARTGSLPFFWDDPDRKPENEELAKNWYNCKPRRVRGNQQTPHSPMGIASNHVFGGEQAATYTRFVRLPFEKATSGDKAAFQKLKAAQAEASGAFPQLIALGYPRDEINEIESELLQYLPLAHARIAQSLAIVVWYAEKIIELTGSSENVKQWVIDNCCKSENDSDASGDSLQDFIDKILILESESSAGDWNFKRKVVRDGRLFNVIFVNDVWKLVDHRFKPATYNERSLKSLVLKSGGITGTTARFFCDRDQSLAYKRLLLNPRHDAEGDPIIPKPPETIPRKAWLIPASLFGETEKEDKPVTDVTERNQNRVTPSNPYESNTFDPSNTPCNRVTVKNELKEKKEEEESYQNQTHIPGCVSSSNPNPGYSSYTPSANQKTEENQAQEPVTEVQAKPVTPVTPVTRVTEQEPVTEVQLQPVTPRSLLEIEQSGGDINEYVDCEVEVRSCINGKVNSVGRLSSGNVSPEGNVAVITLLKGEEIAHIREVYLIGNKPLMGRLLEVWENVPLLGELAFSATPEQLQSALMQCSPEQVDCINNAVFELVEASVMWMRDFLPEMDTDTLEMSIENWEPKFLQAVKKGLTQDEREALKQIAASPKDWEENSENSSPSTANSNPDPDNVDLSGDYNHEWKAGDRANHLGYSVSIYSIDRNDGSIMVRREDGELFNAERHELFKLE